MIFKAIIMDILSIFTVLILPYLKQSLGFLQIKGGQLLFGAILARQQIFQLSLEVELSFVGLHKTCLEEYSIALDLFPLSHTTKDNLVDAVYCKLI